MRIELHHESHELLYILSYVKRSFLLLCNGFQTCLRGHDWLVVPFGFAGQKDTQKPMMACSTLTDDMIVSIASQKGGTGKTTTSISLAAGLAKKGKKVLLIDIDSQANSSKVLLPDYPTITKDQTIFKTILERQPLPIHTTAIPTLEIVPSHILLSNTDVELTTAKDHREARLKRELDQIKHRYDFVFIDCPLRFPS